MKFHSLEIENINSLYNKQQIDFDRDLATVPLFLIVGPTASGKSTLLDAICLALFGETPRLRKKSQDIAQIMSHGTAESRVILEFSKKKQNKRIYYKAEWHKYLARKKQGGAPQEALRSLSCREDLTQEWEALVVNSKLIKEYQPHFDEVLEGIDVDDFLRSVLLAQGDFAKMLEASQDEKAKLLEKLTGTELYKRIGELASIRFKEIKHRYQQMTKHQENLQQQVSEGELEKIEENIQKEKLALVWVEKEMEQWKKREKQAHLQAENQKQFQQKENDFNVLVEKNQSTESQHWEKKFNLYQLIQKKEGDFKDWERLSQNQTELEKIILLKKSQLFGKQQEKELQKKELQGFWEQKESFELRWKEEFYPSIKRGLELSTEIFSKEKEWNRIQEKKKLQEEQMKSILSKKQTLSVQEQEQSKELQQLSVEVEKNETLKQQAQFDQELKDCFGHAFESQQKGTEVSQKLLELQTETSKHQQQEQAWISETKQQESIRAEIQVREKARREALEALRTKSSVQSKLQILTKVEKEQKEIESTQRWIFAWKNWLLWTNRKNKNEEILCKTKTEIETLQQKELQHSEKQRDLEGKLSKAKQEQDYASMVFGLVEERRRLEAEQPCPLCFSEVHPFREKGGLESIESEAQKRAEEAEKTLFLLQEQEKKVWQQLSESQTLRKEKQSLYENLLLDLSEMEIECERQEAELLKIPLSSPLMEKGLLEWTEENLQQIESNIREKWEVSKEDSKQWDELEKQEQEHTEQVRENSSKLVSLQNLLEISKESQKQTLSQIEYIEQQVTIYKKEKEKNLQKAKDFFKEYPWIQEILAFEESLESFETKPSEFVLFLEQLVFLLRQQASDLEHKKKSLERWSKEKETLLQQEDSLKQSMTERLLEEQQLQEDKSRLQSELSKRLGDETLSVYETRVNKEKQEHESRWQGAQQKFQECEKNVHSLEELLLKYKQEWEEIKAQVGSKEILVQELEKQSQLDRLELRALFAESEAIRRFWEEKVQRDSQMKLLKEDLSKLEEQKELWKSEWETLELSQIIEELKEKESVKSEHQLGLGTFLERERQIKKGLAEQESMHLDLENMQKEYGLWDEMNQLIGKREGLHFRRFVQAINLQRIAKGANVHLKRMFPRYSLDVAREEKGFPTLDFVVLDHYQADEPRKTETLSGGERFLVSLALALSLSDQYANRLHIETLLLDEGFGTLDSESLESAIQQLNTLSIEFSQQIGIISHVEELKEKIFHHIVVEKQSNGRSNVRFTTSI